MAVISFNQNAKGENESITIKGNEEEIEKIINYVKHMYVKHTDNDGDDNSNEVYAEVDMVNHPSHYCGHGIETIKKIDAVLDGIGGREAYYLGNILKYFDRAGLKDDTEQDLKKANNYACRLVTGEWRKW